MQKRVINLALVILVWAAWAAAQEQTGTLYGTVAGASGARLAGATLAMTGADRGVIATTRTDTNGEFSVAQLPPDRYSLLVQAPGHRDHLVRDIDVLVGRHVSIDVTLVAGDTTDAITPPVARTTHSSSDLHNTAEEIARLFRWNDFTSLILRSPGAFPEPFAGGIVLLGATALEHRYVVDGIETTDVVSGGSAKNVVPEVIDDVQVKLSGYSAEHGGSTGSVVNVISRAGSNTFHGTVGLYYNENRWNGAQRSTLRRAPSDIGRAEYVIYPRDDRSTAEPNYTLGGPAWRDRLWFFSSHLARLIDTTRTVTFLANGNQGSFDQATRTHASLHNLTGRAPHNALFKLAAGFSPSAQNNLLPALDGTSNPLTDFGIDVRAPQTTYSGWAHATLADRWSVGLSGGRFAADTRQLGVFQGTRYVFSGANTIFPEIPPDLRGVNGFSNVLTNFETTRDRRWRTQLQADVATLARWGGLHQVKAGVQWDRIGVDRLSGETGNAITLRWNQALGGIRGAYGYYEVSSNDVLPDRGQLRQGAAASTNVGLFVQDAWTFRDGVQVDLGLRTENERIPSFAADAAIPDTAIRFGFGDKLAPRLGVSWDPTGRGETKVYGSWGLYYDITKINLPFTLFGGLKSSRYFYALETFDWRSLDRPGCPPACPGTLILGPVLSGSRPANDPRANSIDPDIQQMRTQEFTAGIERRLGRTWSLGLRYTHRQLDRAVENVGTLALDQSEVSTIGNPGFGRAATFSPRGTSEVRELPRAVRDYDAVQLLVTRRLADRWSLTAQYAWSRLWGNYAGLADTDTGVLSPNTTRAFDYPVMSFDSSGREALGPLATDRPHHLLTMATYSLPFGTHIGLWAGVSSGSPVTRWVNVIPPNNYPLFYQGRGSDGRLPRYPFSEFYVRHTVRLRGRTALEVDAGVLNLFDFKNAIFRYPIETQVGAGIVLDEAAFYRGLDIPALMAQQRIAKDPRFLMDGSFQTPRTVRLGVNLRF